MIRTVLLACALIPKCGYGSVVYTFIDRQLNQGSFGFSMTVPDYVQTNDRGFYSFDVSQLASCDTSANPTYACAGGSFLQGSNNSVDVTLGLRDTTQIGFGSTDAITETFLGASLTSEGSTIGLYPGPGDKIATFTVRQVADSVPTPEPSTFGSLVAAAASISGFALIRAIQSKKKHCPA